MKAWIILATLLAAPLVRGDDLKTTTGEDYKGVTISRVEPDGLMVITSTGIVKVYFTELPKEVQEKYHYNPKQAETFQFRLRAAKAAAKDETDLAKEKRRQEFIQNSEAQKQRPTQHQASYENPLEQAPQEKWAITGKILSVAEGGALILCSNNGAIGMRTPAGDEVVFVKGQSASELTDDDPVRCVGVPNGRFQYTSAGNAQKTVRSFDLIELQRLRP